MFAVLENDFVEPDLVQIETARTAAINGIIDSLGDPHSAYIDADTFRLTGESISGEFEGIGATVNSQEEGIVIAQPFRDSPAEAAGIRPGDVILAVDGDSTEGWSLQLAAARIRGPQGTSVEITVRHRDGKEETVSVERTRVIVPSVETTDILDREGNPVTDIGYLRITQFTQHTRDELLPILRAIRDTSQRRVIIDLRSNPGGLLTATVNTTDEFIDEGIVLIEVARDGSEQVFRSSDGGLGTDMDLVVLVNGGSASGSEVMASALRDHGRAILIGEQTLGKGTVNIPRRLSDGGVLYVSVARWLTPSRFLIEGIGADPDIVVVPTDADFQEQHVQLWAAIEYFREGAAVASETAAR